MGDVCASAKLIADSELACSACAGRGSSRSPRNRGACGCTASNTGKVSATNDIDDVVNIKFTNRLKVRTGYLCSCPGRGARQAVDSSRIRHGSRQLLTCCKDCLRVLGIKCLDKRGGTARNHRIFTAC